MGGELRHAARAVKPASQTVNRGQQVAARAEAITRDAVEQLELRQFHPLVGIIIQPEGIVEGAEVARALAGDRLLPLMEMSADRDEPRQLLAGAQHARDKGAVRRLQPAW